MPKTHANLLRRVAHETNHVTIPRNLHGAARGLWAHDDGHMVSLCHQGDKLLVRLTGRGQDLVATLAIGSGS